MASAALDSSGVVETRSVPRCALWQLRSELRGGWAADEELSTAECLDLVAQLAELGVLEVTLQSGEAYPRKDWLSIVAAIRQHELECTLTSSGRGLHMQSALAAQAAGLQTVSIAIDGLERTHDRLRGVAGSYRTALGALTNLRAAGIPVSVSTQIERLSLGELEPLLECIIAQGVHSWQVQLKVASGSLREDAEVLLPPDLRELSVVLSQLKHSCDEAGVRLWLGDNIGDFGPHESSRQLSRRARRGTVLIGAGGSIESSLTSAVTGNIRTQSLRELWQRARAAADLTVQRGPWR